MKLYALSVSALLIFNVILCGGPIDQDDLPAVYANNYCARAQKCDPDFDDIWVDRADCEADWEGAVETVLDVSDLFGCDYSPEGGRQCIRAINEGNCADFLDRGDDDIECDYCD